MTQVRTVSLGALLAALLLIATACSINETDVPEQGALFINVTDTTLGSAVLEGQVLLDGVPRANELPAVITASDGDHEITVRPGLLYPVETRTVTVTAPETTSVQINVSANDAPASITIQSGQADAVIVLNDEVRTDLSVGESFLVASGTSSFSLYKQGFKTLAPAMRTLDLEGNTETTLTFTLEPLAEGPAAGDLFPEFAMSNDWGDTTSLAQYRGRVVLVTFWFYNCQPCREEFPYIQQTFQERAAEGFRVVGMNVGWQNDQQDDFEAIREQLDLTFPLTFNDIGFSWTADLEIANAPTNFVLSPTGEILFRRGPITYDDLNDMVDAAFADGAGE